MQKGIIKCIFCSSKNTVKKGARKNKLQTIQKYQCKQCKKYFTLQHPQTKNKTYSISIVLKAISTYNLGNTLQKTAQIINKRYSLQITPPTILAWLNEYKDVCAFNKLRKETLKICNTKNIIFSKTFHHIQPYTFKCHKAKLYLLFHNRLYNSQFHNISLFYEPLKAYLEKIPADKFPHHIFTYQKTSVSSLNADANNNKIKNNGLNIGAGQNDNKIQSSPIAEIENNNLINKNNENLINKNNQILINENNNNETKNKIGNFGTGQNAKNSASSPDAEIANNNNFDNENKIGNIGAGQQINEQRASQIKFSHLKIEAKSKNNLACKLASLALNLAASNKERHQKIQDFFLINDSTTIATEIPIYLTNWDAGYYRNEKGFIFPLNNYETHITGHIDILQIRNGLIHILDYKPDADKIQPIEQLTIYAMALSRKLNLPLYYFKAAWFDENNYFEFFTLHAVYEKQNRKV